MHVSGQGVHPVRKIWVLRFIRYGYYASYERKRMWGNPKRRKNKTGKTGSVYIERKGSLRSAASQVPNGHKVWPVNVKIINLYLCACAHASHRTCMHAHIHICLLVKGKWGEGGACTVASASGDCSTCEEVAVTALGALGYHAVAMELNIGGRGRTFSSATSEANLTVSDGDVKGCTLQST